MRVLATSSLVFSSFRLLGNEPDPRARPSCCFFSFPPTRFCNARTPCSVLKNSLASWIWGTPVLQCSACTPNKFSSVKGNWRNLTLDPEQRGGRRRLPECLQCTLGSIVGCTRHFDEKHRTHRCTPRLHRGQNGIRRGAGLGVIASVKFMRIPCFGRRMTIGRASMVWPGTSWSSYFLSRTLRIMKSCSVA